jgi:hypothetical protein
MTMPPDSLPPNPPAAPIAYQPYDPDQANLNTLSIFYFIFAGLQALIGCFFLIYIGFGIIVGVAGAAGANRPGDAGVAAIFGGAFACFGVALLVICWLWAFLLYKAGRGLRTRKSLTIIYIMAALLCLSVPLGTILGIFTFVVLSRPSVKASFT